MTILGWFSSILALVVAGALGAVVAGLAYREVAAVMRARLAPRWRFATVWFVSSLPLLFPAALIGVAFTPSVLDALGIAADHCSHHVGHAFHLCFVHGTPPGLSWPIVATGAVMAVLLSVAAGREVVGATRARRWTRQIRDLSSYDGSRGAWVVPTEASLAFTVGLLRPTVFLSRRLKRALTGPQLDAVSAHERAHARGRHGLLKSIARVLASLHLPDVRTMLSHELDLASEQVADERAAREVGDRLTVAEAIIRVGRMEGPEAPAGVLGFGATMVEDRVQALLDDQWSPIVPGLLLGGATGILAAAFVSYEQLHHLAESILSYLH